MATALLGFIALAACGDEEGSGGSASFCEAATNYRDANTMVPNPSTASAAQLEAKFTELQDALGQMEDAAPSEIEDDVATVATTFDRFIAAFAAQKYDYAKFIADPDGRQAMDALNSDEMGTAMGNIDQYIDAECGSVQE